MYASGRLYNLCNTYTSIQCYQWETTKTEDLRQFRVFQGKSIQILWLTGEHCCMHCSKSFRFLLPWNKWFTDGYTEAANYLFIFNHKYSMLYIATNLTILLQQFHCLLKARSALINLPVISILAALHWANPLRDSFLHCSLSATAKSEFLIYEKHTQNASLYFQSSFRAGRKAWG